MQMLATIKITGSDGFEFLQGQLTNDLRRLEGEDEILAAWCSPKGRVIWFGAIRSAESGFAVSAPADMADDIVRRLTMFRFRSKVDFEIAEATATVDPAALIADGIPFVGPEQCEEFTPHMLNLDLLDAVSFEKGCYTGQEIVARTHYKGATKRRTLGFESDAPVSAGDKIQLDGRDVGEVLNASGTALLAVVPVDKSDNDLRVGDVCVRKVALPYL